LLLRPAARQQRPGVVRLQESCTLVELAIESEAGGGARAGEGDMASARRVPRSQQLPAAAAPAAPPRAAARRLRRPHARRGCVHQVLQGGAAKGCQTLEEYAALRSGWPYRPAAARFLASPALLALLRALLGEQAFLFNEQVRAPPLAGRPPPSPCSWPPSLQRAPVAPPRRHQGGPPAALPRTLCRRACLPRSS
jgi:hypothetical protein